jgi:cytochrome P450
VNDFIEEAIEEHEKTRIEEEPRDFIDVYLNATEKQVDVQDSSFFKEQLQFLILDLFGAGAESTSNSVGFAILHLMHDPEVQAKLQKELDSVCGDQLPSLTQRSELLYTEAVLMEAQRISGIAPLTVPHYALRDTQLQGHTIPKGSFVSVNLHSIHLDGTFWKDPLVFRPERHLNEQGKIIKTDHFIPFGVGKRMCLGESLAKNAYFLFTASLIKTFRFDKVPNQPLPTLDPINGFTLGYDGFSAMVTPRN